MLRGLERKSALRERDRVGQCALSYRALDGGQVVCCTRDFFDVQSEQKAKELRMRNHLPAHGEGLSFCSFLHRHELSQVEASIIRVQDQIYRLPSKMSPESEMIYRATGIARSAAAVKIEAA